MRPVPVRVRRPGREAACGVPVLRAAVAGSLAVMRALKTLAKACAAIAAAALIAAVTALLLLIIVFAGGVGFTG